jgi:hypothetical protein
MRWPGHRLALTLAAGVLVIWAAAMALTLRAAALPTSASGTMLAVFEPGTPQEMQFAALINAGGRPLRTTWLPFVWVVAGDEAGFAGRLMAAGAIGTYGDMPLSPSLAGCFAYADAKAAELFSIR